MEELGAKLALVAFRAARTFLAVIEAGRTLESGQVAEFTFGALFDTGGAFEEVALGASGTFVDTVVGTGAASAVTLDAFFLFLIDIEVRSLVTAGAVVLGGTEAGHAAIRTLGTEAGLLVGEESVFAFLDTREGLLGDEEAVSAFLTLVGTAGGTERNLGDAGFTGGSLELEAGLATGAGLLAGAAGAAAEAGGTDAVLGEFVGLAFLDTLALGADEEFTVAVRALAALAGGAVTELRAFAGGALLGGEAELVAGVADVTSILVGAFEAAGSTGDTLAGAGVGEEASTAVGGGNALAEGVDEEVVGGTCVTFVHSALGTFTKRGWALGAFSVHVLESVVAGGTNGGGSAFGTVGGTFAAFSNTDGVGEEAGLAALDALVVGVQEEVAVAGLAGLAGVVTCLALLVAAGASLVVDQVVARRAEVAFLDGVAGHAAGWAAEALLGARVAEQTLVALLSTGLRAGHEGVFGAFRAAGTITGETVSSAFLALRVGQEEGGLAATAFVGGRALDAAVLTFLAHWRAMPSENGGETGAAGGDTLAVGVDEHTGVAHGAFVRFVTAAFDAVGVGAFEALSVLEELVSGFAAGAGLERGTTSAALGAGLTSLGHLVGEGLGGALADAVAEGVLEEFIGTFSTDGLGLVLGILGDAALSTASFTNLTLIGIVNEESSLALLAGTEVLALEAAALGVASLAGRGLGIGEEAGCAFLDTLAALVHEETLEAGSTLLVGTGEALSGGVALLALAAGLGKLEASGAGEADLVVQARSTTGFAGHALVGGGVEVLVLVAVLDTLAGVLSELNGADLGAFQTLVVVTGVTVGQGLVGGAGLASLQAVGVHLEADDAGRTGLEVGA